MYPSRSSHHLNPQPKFYRTRNVLQAEAYAHWSMVQPALNFFGVPKGQLQGIESMLNPAVWRAAANDYTALKALYKQTVLAISEATNKAGYTWTQIAGYKLSVRHMAAANAKTAPEGAAMAVEQHAAGAATADVAAATGSVAAAELGAVAAAAAPEDTPVAAALAALTGMTPDAGGENADPAEDGR